MWGTQKQFLVAALDVGKRQIFRLLFRMDDKAKLDKKTQIIKQSSLAFAIVHLEVLLNRKGMSHNEQYGNSCKCIFVY